MTYFCHTLDTNLPQQESGRERVIHMFVNRMWINREKQNVDSTAYAQEKPNKNQCKQQNIRETNRTDKKETE